MQRSLRLAILYLVAIQPCYHSFQFGSVSIRTFAIPLTDYRPRSSLKLAGFFDSVSSFLRSRDGDFMKLDRDGEVYGPGPLLVLFNMPLGISDDEIMDMISDGAPTASSRGCQLCRVFIGDEEFLDRPLSECLEIKIQARWQQQQKVQTVSIGEMKSSQNPVLLFSGFRNDEMLSTFQILSQEIFVETNGQLNPACAKVVPNAMNKALRQIFDEILGDHQDALSSN